MSIYQCKRCDFEILPSILPLIDGYCAPCSTTLERIDERNEASLTSGPSPDLTLDTDHMVQRPSPAATILRRQVEELRERVAYLEQLANDRMHGEAKALIARDEARREAGVFRDAYLSVMKEL